MRLDYIQKLTVEASNPKGVDPDKLNPIIKEFRLRLEELRLQDKYDDLKGRIVDLDEFRFTQVTPNLVMFYWDICKWDMVNMTSERIHGDARQKASRLVSSVVIQEDGTTVKVVDVS